MKKRIITNYVFLLSSDFRSEESIAVIIIIIIIIIISQQIICMYV